MVLSLFPISHLPMPNIHASFNRGGFKGDPVMVPSTPIKFYSLLADIDQSLYQVFLIIFPGCLPLPVVPTPPSAQMFCLDRPLSLNCIIVCVMHVENKRVRYAPTTSRNKNKVQRMETALLWPTHLRVVTSSLCSCPVSDNYYSKNKSCFIYPLDMNVFYHLSIYLRSSKMRPDTPKTTKTFALPSNV